MITRGFWIVFFIFFNISISLIVFYSESSIVRYNILKEQMIESKIKHSKLAEQKQDLEQKIAFLTSEAHSYYYKQYLYKKYKPHFSSPSETLYIIKKPK